MEAVVNESGGLKQWRMKLLYLLQMFRHPNMERDLAEAKARIGWQKNHTEQIQQRYNALDRKCVALTNEVESLRSRLYAAEQQAEAFKRVACSVIGTADDFKRIYEAAIPCLDSDGFNLFCAAQEITGFCLPREFPYEDACGCFEFLGGFDLLRYLIASEFGAVSWEAVPDTDCKKAILRNVDESTPAYREFERQLYMRALNRLGLRATTSTAQKRQSQPL